MKKVEIVIAICLALAGTAQAGWVQQVSGVSMDLRAVSFADSLHGIAGGMGGSSGDTLLRTTDGGTTWQIVRTGYPNSTLATFMLTTQIAWATGSTLTVKTTNGGLSWVLEPTANGNGISFSDPLRGLCVGPSGYVWRTTNGGSTWVTETTGLKGDLFDVCMVDSLHAWAVGYDGGADTLSIVVSRDGGQSWTPQQNHPGVGYLAGISFSDTLHGLAVGHDYDIFQTTNGGIVWNPINSGMGSWKNHVILVDSLWGWLVGDGGAILQTTNEGLTWMVQGSGTTQHLFGVSFTDRRNGWAVGDGGTILHTTDGGEGVEEWGQGDKETKRQWERARPNPFTTYATIPGHEGERFEVYDISGRQVGTYGGDRIGMGMPAGIYFLKPEGRDEKPIRIVKVR